MATDDPVKASGSAQRLEFGPFRLEPRERRLWRGSQPITLQPKVFDTLVLLAENAGHLMTKEALMAALWPDAVVEESNLTKNLWTIRKALGEAEGGGQYIETVPRVGYRFVAAVPRAAPAAGAPDAPGPAVAAVREEPPQAAPASEPRVSGSLPALPATPGAPRESKRTPATLLTLGAGAAIAAVVAATLWLPSRLRPRPAPASSLALASAPARRSVAVLGFKNLSGRPDADWLATALSAMVGAEISVGEKRRVVPAENVARRRFALPAGALSVETLSGLRGDLNADEVVLGSYVAILAPGGEQIRMDLIVQDALSGETLASVSRTGTETDLFQLVSDAGRELRSKLGWEGPTAAEAAIVRASLPADAEAARLYSEGLDRLRRAQAVAARDRLVRAVAIEPAFSPAHAALSEAWSALGYDGRAEAEAQKAFERYAGLSREERLAIEARRDETGKKWEAAQQVYRTLADLFPDDVEYGLKLAAVEISGGRASRALETIAALRRLRAPAGQDPRIDLAEADALHALSDWPGELASANRAAQKARASQSVDLLARARLHAGSAQDSLGHPRESVEAWREAGSLFGEAGDRSGQARAWIGLANSIGDRGDYPGALKLYRDALATFEANGDRKGAAHAWSDLAVMDWFLGNAAAAEKEGTRALAISREIDDRRGVVWGLNAVGNVVADQGQFEKARAMQEEAVAIGREMKDREFVAFGLSALGDTALSRGDLSTALSQYEQALVISRELQDASGIAMHENDLGNVFLAQGDLAKARTFYETALADRQRLGQKDFAAETRMLLAQVENEQGNAPKALDLARGAAEVFEGLHQSGNGSIAFAQASRAELAMGRRREAQEDSRRALKVLGENQQNGARLQVLLAQARAEAASGNTAAARAALAQLRRRLAAARWRAFSLEADLVEAEIDLNLGRGEQARRRLAAVAQESKAAGYGLIAKKAESLARDKGSGNPFL